MFDKGFFQIIILAIPLKKEFSNKINNAKEKKIIIILIGHTEFLCRTFKICNNYFGIFVFTLI